MHELSSEKILQSFLNRSIEQYSQLEILLNSIKNKINGTIKTEELVCNFLQLQTETVPIDTQLCGLLNTQLSGTDRTIKLLAEERLRVMQRVFKLNREILSQAEGVKALLYSELHNISTGRFAIKGYVNNNRNDRTIFRTTY